MSGVVYRNTCAAYGQEYTKILPMVAEMNRIKVLWDYKFQTKKQL